jgi:hypothetical protein
VADQYTESLPPAQAPAKQHGRTGSTTHRVAAAQSHPAPAVVQAPTSSVTPAITTPRPASRPASRRPIHKVTRVGRLHRRHKPLAATQLAPRTAPAASVSAVAAGDGARLWLLLALLAITGAVVGTARYQQARART